MSVWARKLKGPVIATFVAGLAYYLVPQSIYQSHAVIEVKNQEKMSIASKIAGNVIKSAPGGIEATFGELWKEHSCVVVFFRRFG